MEKKNTEPKGSSGYSGVICHHGTSEVYTAEEKTPSTGENIHVSIALTLPMAALAAMQVQSNPDPDPGQELERTVFQTKQPYGPSIDICGDVAIVYGIDKTMPSRVKSWRDKGYRIHLMTGVSWGEYQDYYFGRWDGKNHTDEIQTRENGTRIGHGGDVYYMSPGPDYGRYLGEGVVRACEAGVESVHLEEPEFWSFGGHAEGFKREWQQMYGEPWQVPEGSADARWRAGKLMYFLYRRCLQQIFDAVQDWNAKNQKNVRCYVPTHSLLNYASWGIVSPESSLALLNGSNGYIAQVWTGTAREPNIYKGVKKERTFETGFLEYGIMQNLVRATGRGIWYLADPVEDNPKHGWDDYRENYHSTLVASLLQPDVAQYEITPWPERVFGYPAPDVEHPGGGPIPKSYAQELQQVFNALKDMKQDQIEWLSGTSPKLGVAMSDSLMFQRGGPNASDPEFGHFFGLVMPFVKRGMPIQPLQLENFGLNGYLDDTEVLLMTYEGQKPLTPDVHESIVKWVESGKTLVFVDADIDEFRHVREWWNTDGMNYTTPRKHLFEMLGFSAENKNHVAKVKGGHVLYLPISPTNLTRDPLGSHQLYEAVVLATPDKTWSPKGFIALRRGPYLVAAGLDETEPGALMRTFNGSFVDLFDPTLACQQSVTLTPSSRHFLIDLDRFQGEVIAYAGRVSNVSSKKNRWSCTVEGADKTPATLLLRLHSKPVSILVDGELSPSLYENDVALTWIYLQNTAEPRRVVVEF